MLAWLEFSGKPAQFLVQIPGYIQRAHVGDRGQLIEIRAQSRLPQFGECHG
ncbi:hypothetical protein [Nitrosomonas marina]|uniref:hypothetical protein n=1 Tax=Nitrosomonas marina TaxID=917 RepID=UPI0015A52385|nr:hypothetical protein [Nitrosomonas marina]